MKDKFKLLKPFSKYKKGSVFGSFGGLVMGICNEETNEKIYFNDSNYFKLV